MQRGPGEGTDEDLGTLPSGVGGRAVSRTRKRARAHGVNLGRRKAGTRSSEVGLRDCSRQSLHRNRPLPSNGAPEPKHSASFARWGGPITRPVVVKKITRPVKPKKQRQPAAPTESSPWIEKSPSPSSARAPRRRHPVVESCAVATSSPRAAPSSSPRCGPHRHRSQAERLPVAVPCRAPSSSWTLPACSVSTSSRSTAAVQELD
jgi:hypothetical protein